MNVQRIKFLGDCYYCVAGLPDEQKASLTHREDGVRYFQNTNVDEQKDHADACVQLGLEMIGIIADVRFVMSSENVANHHKINDSLVLL